MGCRIEGSLGVTKMWLIGTWRDSGAFHRMEINQIRVHWHRSRPAAKSEKTVLGLLGFSHQQS